GRQDDTPRHWGWWPRKDIRNNADLRVYSRFGLMGFRLNVPVLHYTAVGAGRRRDGGEGPASQGVGYWGAWGAACELPCGPLLRPMPATWEGHGICASPDPRRPC